MENYRGDAGMFDARWQEKIEIEPLHYRPISTFSSHLAPIQNQIFSVDPCVDRHSTRASWTTLVDIALSHGINLVELLIF